MTVATSINENTITCVINNEVYSIQKDHPEARLILKALQDNASDETVAALFDKIKAVETYMDGSVKVNGNTIEIDGEKVHGVIVDRIQQFMADGLPHKPLLRFLERLQSNPSKRSVEQLYTFLEHKNLPITPEGKFLAYKAIRSDWTDKYSGRFSNAIGRTLSMPRNKVDDDANRGCSAGFHVGALDYVKWYGNVESGSDRCVIVEVDPADVVSVPHDHEYSKVRVTTYKVLSEYTGPLPDTLSTEGYDANDIEEYDPAWVDSFEDEVDIVGFGEELGSEECEEPAYEDQVAYLKSIDSEAGLAQVASAEEVKEKHKAKSYDRMDDKVSLNMFSCAEFDPADVEKAAYQLGWNDAMSRVLKLISESK